MFKRLSVVTALAAAIFINTASADGFETMGPGGGGGGGGGGQSCYYVYKKLKTIWRDKKEVAVDTIVRPGDYLLYKIYWKGLCDLRRARLIDDLPSQLRFIRASEGCEVRDEMNTSNNWNGTRVVCKGRVHAGEDGHAFVLAKVKRDCHSGWFANRACLTDLRLGGYACHTIQNYLKNHGPMSSMTDEDDSDAPETPETDAPAFPTPEE